MVHKPVRNWQESIFCSTIRFTLHFGVWWKSHIFDLFGAYWLWKLTIFWIFFLLKWNAHAIRWLPCHYWSKCAVVGVSVGLWTGDNSVHWSRDWVKLVLVSMWWFTNLSEIGRSRYFLQPSGLRFILGYDKNRIFLTFLKPIGFGNLRFFRFFFLLKWNARAIRWLPCHYWSKCAVVGVSVGLWTGDNSVHWSRDWVKLVLVNMWWFTNLSEIGRSRYFLKPLDLYFILGYDENRIFFTFLKPIGFGNLRFFGFFFLLKWNAHAIRWLPCHYWSKCAVVGVSVGLWTGRGGASRQIRGVPTKPFWVRVRVGLWFG